MNDELVIPFDPHPDDVIVVDPHNLSLKTVTLPLKWNKAYRDLLRKAFQQLMKQKKKVPILEYDRLASDIVETIVQLRKGRFLKLVGAGTDNKGLCTVLHPYACHEKVKVALRRMTSRFEANGRKVYDRHKSKWSASSNKSLGVGKMKICKSSPKVNRYTGNNEMFDDAGHSTSVDDDDEGNESSSDIDDSDEKDEVSRTVPNSPDKHMVIPFDPTPNDVVATSNRHWNTKHPGNIAYSNLLDQYVPRFLQQAGQDKKSKTRSDVSEKIVDLIFQRKGRFLLWNTKGSPNPDFCKIISRAECIVKVQSALKRRSGVVTRDKPSRNSQISSPDGIGAKKGLPLNSNLNHKPTDKKVAPPVAKAKTKVKVNRHKEKGKLFASARQNNSVGAGKLETKKNLARAGGAKASKKYGCPEDETKMRQWLAKQKLPPFVADSLHDFGARSIDDVVLMVESKAVDLNGLPPLDLFKLTRAVKLWEERVEDDESYPG